MRSFALAIVMLSTLLGCATTHPGVVQSPSSILASKGQAKLVITRNTDALFLGVQARVDVNGERVAELWRGDSYAVAMQPGKILLSTDAWSTPGRFLAHFDMEADKEYVFEISPRGGHMATLTFFGIAGAAIDAAIDENTGPFAITLKEIKVLR